MMWRATSFGILGALEELSDCDDVDLSRYTLADSWLFAAATPARAAAAMALINLMAGLDVGWC
jgi:hypothetical protein